MSIKIIADSGSDFPKNLATEYDIDIVPLMVNLGEEEYSDGEDITPLELFENMRGGVVYKTSQVPVHRFKTVFTEYAKKGQKCIYIAFSSGLSGTYQAGEMAKTEVLEEYPDFQLEVIDTKAASFGCGLIVYYAAQMAKEGKTMEEIVEAIHFYSEHMEHVFTVDNLEYLYRGGRVSRSAAFVGGLLSIKPVLDVEDGKLVPREKIRGRKKSIKTLVDMIEKRGTDFNNQMIGISHGDDLETAEFLKSEINERLGNQEFIITSIGAVIGAHTGPGTIALFFLNKDIPNKYQ